MKFGKYTLILVATFLLILSSFTAFLYGSKSANSHSNDESEYTDGSKSKSSASTNITINNNVQNIINGGSNITVETNITNDLNGDVESSIKNQIDNEVNGDGDAEITNNVNNLMNGQSKGIVDNMIENMVNGNGENSIDNNLINKFGENTDVNVFNNVLNNSEKSSGGSKDEKGNNKENDDTDGSGNGTIPDDLDEIVWGIDSASETTEEFYSCVRENFGDPIIFGRYLGDREGVSRGLTADQVELIHSEGAYILPIYNHFNDATGYDNGVTHAEEAIRMAEELGIPEGVALFANIEPIYPVDAEFILGWYETMEASSYESGVYGLFDPDSDIFAAYNSAAESNEDLLENNVIWTSYPNVGITVEDEAPEFAPEAPEGSLAYGWQYGIDAETCNIDTNLFDQEIIPFLWEP